MALCRMETGDLLDAERRVLECLGARPSQRMEMICPPTFSEGSSSTLDAGHQKIPCVVAAALLKARIARFLHNPQRRLDWLR